MESIEIQWQKQSSGDVYTLPNRQYFQQQSILKRDSQEIKPKKKKVQFKIRTPTPKIQAFENTEHNHSKIDRSQRSILEDHDYILPSTNILTAELLETCGKQVCSTRSKSLTIIIVLFIILTVAIVVGVVVGVTNSKQSISETTTTINNQTSSLVSTTTLVSSISIGSQSGPPCSSYTTINDPSRNVAQASLYGFCDNGAPFNTSNGGSWIRFIGTGGTTIPLTSPDENRCGGYFGGWFNGTLPTTVGIVVNGTVRFGIDRNPGIFWVSMSVINCGSFYVYFLPPVTSCSLRYCTT